MSFLDSPDNWPKLDTHECIFLGRALKEISQDHAWEALQTGALVARVYCIGRTDFGPVPLSPLEFLKANRDRLFDTCQIDVVENDTRRPARIRRRIRVPHWIYVTRASVEKLSRSKSTAANETRAIDHLAKLLKANPDMTRAMALNECAPFNLGVRPFERVWVRARLASDLSERAKAGRKKSPR